MTGILQAILSFFGVQSSSAANYIEDVFSTYLYTGNGSTQTINNGIDLAGKGGLVWSKLRQSTASHYLVDTVRGRSSGISSNSTGGQTISSAGSDLTSFTTTGYTLGPVEQWSSSNANSNAIVSWTFREQAKFFDVVTFTASAAAAYTFNHNLGSTPGFVIIKPTSVAGAWYCYHTSLGVNKYLLLNTTDASGTNPSGNWAATSTTFTVPTDFLSGGTQTYVAYLFANNAGGFGASGNENVISCGSFNAASVTTTTLGYEPQWLMFKQSDGVGNWRVVDNMRGWPASGNPQELNPNLSAAETSNGGVNIISTGFTNVLGSGTYIYIAIRRGPMKTPTSGTSVFSPVARTGTSAAATMTAGFAPDAVFLSNRNRSATNYNPFYDKLRGNNAILSSNNTGAEQDLSGSITQYTNTGITLGSDAFGNINASGGTYINWIFQRAPGFFDVVCYTGTGSATTFNHNLTVVPELMIVKSRNNATNWAVYCAYLGGTNPANRYVLLNSSNSFGGTSVYWNDTAPTSTVFTVGTTAATNTSAYTYVNYLFATCAGVSKVGSYTGTGALQTIDCGFAAGARFVLIKRTDSTGDWWVYDSARGITSGNDPYLFLNSTAAEVTNTNYVDTASTGFQVTAAAPAGLNASGGTYIFLAIA